jgi:hypothetical protein
MIDVRIVCTHDALKLAETLMRLLGAEEHQVRVSYGRQSLAELETAEAESDAVLLVWSLDAPSAHYMLQWAARIDPMRLVEIGRTASAHRIEGRRAPVIDFSTWRGERGGRAWNALVDRLRTVQRACEPKGPPPRRAAIALGLVSAAAVGGAMLMRSHDAFDTAPVAPQNDTVASTNIAGDGIGGPLQAIEPASASDVELHFGPIGGHVSHMSLPPDLVLTEIEPAPQLEIPRQRSLLGRINDMTDNITADISASLRRAPTDDQQAPE